MATVAAPLPTRNCVAFYAHLGDVSGVALRDSAGVVSFQADSTGLWTQLADTDRPHLVLCGRVDLAEAQRRTDGPGYTWIERRNTEHASVAA